MTKHYDDNSIKSLKGAERVRKRPSVIFGTNDVKGAFHTIVEILANSLDEARAGYGKKIHVTYHKDGSISVKDEGRGVPMGWNELEGRYNWDLIFNELYAGGKYDEDGDDYEFPLGLNGLGAASTQYASEWFEVVSKRDGKVFKKRFEKGVPLDNELHVEEASDDKTGTYIRWKPDTEVFTSVNFTNDMFVSYLESQAYLNGVTIIFENENNNTEVIFEAEGKNLEDYLKLNLEKKQSTVLDTFTKEVKKSGSENGKKYRAKGSIVLGISEDKKGIELHFHNSSPMTYVHGVHQSAFQSAVVEFFKSIGKQHGYKIIPSDFEGYISIISSTFSNVTDFAHQTKTGVSNYFVYEMVYEMVKDVLEEAYAMQKKSITSLIEKVLYEAEKRKMIKQLEEQQKFLNNVVKESKKMKSEKLVDCVSKDNTKTELILVEGESAKDACVKGRNRDYQAVLATRGKPINALKAPLDKLLENKQVREIISAIGAGVETEDVSAFDINNCRFSKIIVTTDGDIDGQQIRVLFYTIFYRLFPTLLKEGRVYVALTPLYEIIVKEGSKGTKSYFAYDVKEYEAILSDLNKKGKQVVRIKRSKGLGENNPDMLNYTTLNPETRRLVQLKIDPKEQIVFDISHMLFGEDPTKERRDLILSLLEDKLGKDYDVSDLFDIVAGISNDESGNNLDLEHQEVV